MVSKLLLMCVKLTVILVCQWFANGLPMAYNRLQILEIGETKYGHLFGMCGSLHFAESPHYLCCANRLFDFLR
jgi:hypothetical protein